MDPYVHRSDCFAPNQQEIQCLRLQLSECRRRLQHLQQELHLQRKDNVDMRELAVFLDDGRQRAQAAASQWKDFGENMAKTLDVKACKKVI